MNMLSAGSPSRTTQVVRCPARQTDLTRELGERLIREAREHRHAVQERDGNEPGRGLSQATRPRVLRVALAALSESIMRAARMPAPPRGEGGCVASGPAGGRSHA
jgi:hypothetical protein